MSHIIIGAIILGIIFIYCVIGIVFIDWLVDTEPRFDTDFAFAFFALWPILAPTLLVNRWARKRSRR